MERKRNTNLKNSSFTSVVWVLELIDWTLVNGVFLLQVENGGQKRVQQGNGKNKQTNKKHQGRNKSIGVETNIIQKRKDEVQGVMKGREEQKQKYST